MVFGQSYGNINPTVKIPRLRSLQFVVTLKGARIVTKKTSVKVKQNKKQKLIFLETNEQKYIFCSNLK